MGGRTGEASTGPGPRLAFRPDIEGLRAVAVGLVVVLHAGLATVSGGYAGVDVFFVISGFLITSLLTAEVRTTGRVSILGFYARRARRILPAACVVITVTVLASYIALGPLIGRSTAIDGQWAAWFAANFRLIRTGTDYFASSLPPSPLQHFWSLAVEEQFYVVWPTVLFALVALGRRFGRSARFLHLGLIAIVAGSLYWSIHLTRIDPTTAYFSPFTRAWELGAGALVAVFAVELARTPAVLRALATWVGLAMLMLTAFTFTATTSFPGYAALLPVAGTAFIVAGGIGDPRGGAGFLIGVRPLRLLGKISFSVYLWHWPVLIIAEERSATPLSNIARITCVLVTLALSIASYFLIEQPFRSSALLGAKHPNSAHRRSLNALALGAVAIALAVGVSVYTNNRATFAIDHAAGSSASGQAGSSLTTTPALSPAQELARLQAQVRTLVQQGLQLHNVPRDVEPPVLKIATAFDPKYYRCMQANNAVAVHTCTFGAAHSKLTVVVFGDSHAMTWMPALDAYGQQAGYRMVAFYKASCPAPSVTVYVGVARTATPQCTTWRNSALAYIRAVKPAVVIIAFSNAITTPSGPRDLNVWRSGLTTSVRSLQSSGARVVEIGPNTYLPEDPGLCLSRPAADPAACGGEFSETDRSDVERAVIRSSGAQFIDTEPWFCIDGKCPAIIDKRIAYANSGHVSAQYVADLEPLMAAALRTAGLR